MAALGDAESLVGSQGTAARMLGHIVALVDGVLELKPQARHRKRLRAARRKLTFLLAWLQDAADSRLSELGMACGMVARAMGGEL